MRRKQNRTWYSGQVIWELDVSRKRVDCRVVPPRNDEQILMEGLSFDELRMTDWLEEYANWIRLVNGQIAASFLLAMTEGIDEGFVLRQAQDDRLVGGICELDVSRNWQLTASFLLVMT